MDQTQSSLIRGITDFQDHQRWFEFQKLYRPMICKILLKKGLREQELDDGVQEVFLSLLSTVQRFRYDRTKGRFRSWVSKITQRAASAHRRKRRAIPVDPLSMEEPCVEDSAAVDLTDERMKLCLDMARSQFGEHTWLPFYLRVVEECPIEEVEKITGMSRNAVYQAVHRVRSCLREMVAHLEGNSGEGS